MLYYLKKYPFSLLVIAVVIYLSFFRPPSMDDFPLFPGVDKVVHFCMYGGVSGMLWLEFLRNHRNFEVPLWHAWIGAVFAAAVILPEDFRSEELNDSKQLSERKRYALRPVIEREAIAWAVGIVTPEEIDRINILRASFLAMHRAIDQLRVKPAHLLIDGNRFTPYPGIPHTTVVKGDGKYLSIAAASILAKTYRDDYMNRLAEEYPAYHWDENKGYPTRAHREAIRMHGITPYHRKTFTLLPEQLELKF